MREILFRGKSRYAREWVEGFFATKENESYIIRVEKVRPDLEAFVVVEVIPETVGQFTGLTDYKGEKIFEGDILKDKKSGCNELNGVVEYNKAISSFIVVINDTTPKCFHWSPLNEGNPLRCLQLQYTFKIGNIHDNPELLEV